MKGYESSGNEERVKKPYRKSTQDPDDAFPGPPADSSAAALMVGFMWPSSKAMTVRGLAWRE
jgi:hypothetical protein